VPDMSMLEKSRKSKKWQRRNCNSCCNCYKWLLKWCTQQGRALWQDRVATNTTLARMAASNCKTCVRVELANYMHSAERAQWGRVGEGERARCGGRAKKVTKR